jgi:hypothetical protein
MNGSAGLGGLQPIVRDTNRLLVLVEEVVCP